ncbi:MAG: hypothetical protein IKH38_03130 [Clostridia bacterium]|nr:hypothetical protein [Clostridia bacterium]
MHAYCLFCETQKCGIIARQMQEWYGFRCISPQIIQRKWIKGVCTEQRHNWLPGYVFLYAEEPVKERCYLPGVLRWLGDGELQNEDLRFAEMLLDRDGVMGTVHLAEVGDRCVIDDPNWEGLNGTVTKIDRGRRRCCVEFCFDGVRRTVWVGYERVRIKDNGSGD